MHDFICGEYKENTENRTRLNQGAQTVDPAHLLRRPSWLISCGGSHPHVQLCQALPHVPVARELHTCAVHGHRGVPAILNHLPYVELCQFSLGSYLCARACVIDTVECSSLIPCFPAKPCGFLYRMDHKYL